MVPRSRLIAQQLLVKVEGLGVEDLGIRLRVWVVGIGFRVVGIGFRASGAYL